MEPRRVRKIVGGPLEPSWEIAPLGDEFPGKVSRKPLEKKDHVIDF